MKQLFIISLIAFLLPLKTEAQFLKKLQNSVKQSVENTAIDQAAGIASQKTAEAMDKSVEKTSEAIGNLFKKMKNKKKRKNGDTASNNEEGEIDLGDMETMMQMPEIIDASILPNSYDFEWFYTMQLQNDEGIFNMDYYLQPNANYFAVRPNLEQEKAAGYMIMVMDFDNNANTIFMDAGGQKMATPSAIPNLEAVNNGNEEQKQVSFKELPTKKILGYECLGVQIDSDEFEIVVYLTTEAPVSFTNFFSAQKNNSLKGYNPVWFSEIENSLVMEMIYKSKEDNTTTTMKCVSLKENEFSIKKSDYKFMNLTR